VKQEMHLKEVTMVKKHQILVNGQNLEEEEFATEVEGYLGAFAMTNLFFVDNLKSRQQQKKSNDSPIAKSNKEYREKY
jgi:hypothetical protein